ncbi:MAG TPA: response regulator transcription factor [Chitinophaga sp.]|uniref:response regulator transcription factor n=1 Tax=Chitinophaga sp. TaxID=1869181 RepID=UPI002C46943A|nr:response regulator transcription factor [Chitinophaga sp.]HVI47528.1 response regulator transcription factor [Chitinophaga sp.]
MIYKILYADDDRVFSGVIGRILEETKHFKVHYAADGSQAWKLFNDVSFDACLLDIVMPKLDGKMLAEKIRGVNRDIPIFFLTTNAAETDIKEAYDDAEVDDYYIKKDLNPPILFRKLKAQCRRYNKMKKRHELGEYIFDVEENTLTRRGDSVLLSPILFKLLRLFVKNKNTNLARETIVRSIWGDEVNHGLNVYIRRLREHLEDDKNVSIETVKKFGYGLWIYDRKKNDQ